MGRNDEGFTLIEVVVAVAVGLSLLAAWAAVQTATDRAQRGARRLTLATLLARSKLDQLEALTFRSTVTGDVVADETDRSTNLAMASPASGGGGLTATSVATLLEDVAGSVDYFDEEGTWVGGSGVRPARAAFVRRWAVTELPGTAGLSLLFEVRVADAHKAPGLQPSSTDDVWLVAARPRTLEQ